MGGKSSKQALADVRTRVRARTGSIQLSGRYHRLPRTISDDYDVDDTVLGTGNGGAVFSASSRSEVTGAKRRFAVKGFKLRGLDKDHKQVLEAEVEIFLQLDHPHVCRLFDVYESNDRLELVMECLDGGELWERISKKRRFSERDAADATHQMLLAINYLHTIGVVHRDLKLENFLYDSKDSNHLKLIDFGFGKIWNPGSNKMKAQLGTLAYVAPEVFLKSYTNMCDLWSLGVIVFVLLVGHLPFRVHNNPEQTMLDVLNGDMRIDEAKWRRVSQSAYDFVTHLLEREPAKRLTAVQAMEHPWIVQRERMESKSALDQTIVDSLCQFANATRFRRACMQVMAWSLTNEERAQVREAFIELDLSKSGSIKLHELRQVLEERFSIEDDEARRVFEALDSNSNEEVHYSEFLAAMMCSRIEIHEGLVLSAFRRFSQDNSGVITLDNLQEVLGESLDGTQAEGLVKEARLMSDGNGNITLDDFMAYLCSDDARESHKEVAGLIIEACMARNPEMSPRRAATPSMTPKGRHEHLMFRRPTTASSLGSRSIQSATVQEESAVDGPAAPAALPMRDFVAQGHATPPKAVRAEPPSTAWSTPQSAGSHPSSRACAVS